MRGCVNRQGLDARGFTSRAVQVRETPRLTENSSTLRITLIAVEAFGRQLQIHAGIRSWRPSCRKERYEFQARRIPMPERQFVNYYRCPEDGEEWADVWSCCCNDGCPKCGLKDIEPYKSEEIVHTRPGNTEEIDRGSR